MFQDGGLSFVFPEENLRPRTGRGGGRGTTVGREAITDGKGPRVSPPPPQMGFCDLEVTAQRLPPQHGTRKGDSLKLTQRVIFRQIHRKNLITTAISPNTQTSSRGQDKHVVPRVEGNRLQASGHHLRGLLGASGTAEKKKIENPGGKPSLTTHPESYLPSLRQGEESKWMRTQRKAEF